MKSGIGIVIGFIIRAIVLAAAGALFVTAVRFGTGYDPAANAIGAKLARLFLDSLATVLVPAVMVSFAVSLLRLVFVVHLRRLSGAVLWLVFAGVLGISLQHSDSIAQIVPLRAGALTPVVRTGELTRFPEADLFVTERDGYSLLNVVLFTYGEQRGFRHEEEVFVDPFAREIDTPGGLPSLSMREALTGPTVLFHPPVLVERMALVFERSEALFQQYLNASVLRFWIEVLAFAFAAAGAWAFAHMSRWPLLNAVVTLSALAVLPVIHVVLYDPDVQSLFGSVFTEPVRIFAPSMVLAAVGLTCLAAGLLFTAPDRLRAETGH